MANDEFCEECEQEYQEGRRKKDERKAPLFGWDKEDAPNYAQKRCWEHWAPSHKMQTEYSEFVVKNKADLRNAELSSAKLAHANLAGAQLVSANLDRADLACAVLESSNLQDADLPYATLKGAKLWDSNLKGADFTGANIEGANFYNLMESKRCIVIQTEYTLWVALGDCLRWVLRKGRNRVTRWDSVNGAHTIQTDSVTVIYIRDNAYIEDFRKRHRFRAWLWRWTCFYGQSLWLWVFWCLVVAVAFGAFYSTGTLVALSASDLVSLKCGNRVVAELPSWLTPYYFSIVTFTTLGFGDIRPLNCVGELVVIIEVVFGYVALGLLISIFANKVARRA